MSNQQFAHHFPRKGGAFPPEARRILLVTEELAGLNSSGGIGAAFRELALVLARGKRGVDLLYIPSESLDEHKLDQVKLWYASAGVMVLTLDASEYVNAPSSAEAKSYAVSKWIRGNQIQYSVVHFHDYKGLGYFTAAAKRFGLLDQRIQLVVQAHGSTRWALEANAAFFTHEDQLKIDFMEKRSLEWADWVVSPSAYLVDWMRSQGYRLPEGHHKVRVIKNACTEIASQATSRRKLEGAPESGRSKSIVMFGRHEERKGLVVFCDAIDLIAKEIESCGVSVTFMGGMGTVLGQPSLAYLMERAAKWTFPVHMRTGLARDEAARHLLSLPSPLCVIPSPYENSPYTVLESIMLGIPTVSSVEGGGPELFREGYAGLVNVEPKRLSEKLLESITLGIGIPEPAQSAHEIDLAWTQFHEELQALGEREILEVEGDPEARGFPLVTVGITHHERPGKLVDAILSIARQTYKSIELLVVDDGSASAETVQMLEAAEVLLGRIGGRLIRRENGYLGAARNTVIAEASGKYIVFLDDDDIARPEMLERLVVAIQRSGLPCVNCLNAYMNESERGRYTSTLGTSDKDPPKPSYIPLGGPLALGPIQNGFGGATAIFDLSALRAMGGYSELKGVGHEDYELFLRFAQAGHSVGVVPEVLYHYEVGRPSMLTRTSLARNFRRCFDALEIEGSKWAPDFVSLVVGKQTSIDAHNRQYWLYGQRVASEELRSLMLASSRKERLELGLRICEMEGHDRFASTIAGDLYSTGDLGDGEESRRRQVSSIRLSVPKRGSSWASRQIFSAKLAFALDNERAAFSHMEDVILLEDGVSLQDWTELAALVAEHGCGPISIDARAALLSAMVKTERSGENEQRAIAESFASLSREDTAALLTRFGIDCEEAEYLAAYPDVSRAVARGDFVSGVAHYIAFGREEERGGFAGLGRIMRVLHSRREQEALRRVTLVLSAAPSEA